MGQRRVTDKKPTGPNPVMPDVRRPVQSVAPVQTDTEHVVRGSTAPMLHEELAQLQQWLAGLKYADVRRVEHVLPAKRADGRVLRGIRIIRRLYLARDRVFYRVAWDESVAKPVSLVEVLSIVRASFVALRFRAYSMRQKRLRTTRSISRP